jgi:uncharacterized protein YjiS (DUF1127 family)
MSLPRTRRSESGGRTLPARSFRQVMHGFIWLAHAYRRERRIARDRKLLRSFDDDMLCDIDLTRADIEGRVLASIRCR